MQDIFGRFCAGLSIADKSVDKKCALLAKADLGFDEQMNRCRRSITPSEVVNSQPVTFEVLARSSAEKEACPTKSVPY